MAFKFFELIIIIIIIIIIIKFEKLVLLSFNIYIFFFENDLILYWRYRKNFALSYKFTIPRFL